MPCASIFIGMTKNSSNSKMTETRMFRALELLGAVRHTGSDAKGRQVIVAQLRGVTYVLSPEHLRLVDADHADMAIEIFNAFARLVRAAHQDVEEFRSGVFTQETKATFEVGPFDIAKECEMLKENLLWLEKITGGDIDWSGNDEFPLDQLGASIPNILGKMLALRQAMRAKLARMILQKELDASEPKEKAADAFVAVAVPSASPETAEVRWKRRRT